jgi:hypothetical protein
MFVKSQQRYQVLAQRVISPLGAGPGSAPIKLKSILAREIKHAHHVYG